MPGPLECTRRTLAPDRILPRPPAGRRSRRREGGAHFADGDHPFQRIAITGFASSRSERETSVSEVSLVMGCLVRGAG